MRDTDRVNGETAPCNYGDSNLNSNGRPLTCSIVDTGIKVTVTVIDACRRLQSLV
jgi:hypothetical protein